MAKIPYNVLDRVKRQSSQFFKKRLKDLKLYAKENPGKTALFGAAAAAPVAMYALTPNQKAEEEATTKKMASFWKEAEEAVSEEIERAKAEAPKTPLSAALQGQKNLDEAHRPDPLADMTGSELPKEKEKARTASKQTLADDGGTSGAM